MVAVGILGICLLPILSAQISINSGTQRFEHASLKLQLEQKAESYIRGLPSSALNQGSALIDGYALNWKLTASSEPAAALSDAGTRGRFEIRIVEISYELSTPSDVLAKGESKRLAWVPVASFFGEE